MRRRKRTEIVVEKDQVVVIRRLERRTPEWCEACGEHSRMVTVDEAAAIRRVSARMMYQQAEAAQVHFTERADGRLFICLASLVSPTPTSGQRRSAEAEQIESPGRRTPSPKI